MPVLSLAFKMVLASIDDCNSLDNIKNRHYNIIFVGQFWPLFQDKLYVNMSFSEKGCLHNFK